MGRVPGRSGAPWEGVEGLAESSLYGVYRFWPHSVDLASKVCMCLFFFLLFTSLYLDKHYTYVSMYCCTLVYEHST